MVYLFFYFLQISFIFRTRQKQWYKQTISAGSEAVEFDSPAKLIAKDFGDFEIQIYIGR